MDLVTLPLLYHAVNRFLASLGGELLKKSVESLVLVIVCYMLYSEYRRELTNHTKYLFFGFGVLAIERILMTFFLASVVFAGVDPGFITVNFIILDYMLELFAFVLIANAFVYPILKGKVLFAKRMKTEIIIVAFVYLLLQFLWIIKIKDMPSFNNVQSGLFISLEVIKIMVLLYPVFLLTKRKLFDKYSKNVIIAFLIFCITPILSIIAIIFFHGFSPYLRIISHPFPFIAIMLFMRLVYLKLVDKAILREQLHEARQKYMQTKQVSDAKDEFVSVVSHELRTPLTSMKLYISLMLSGKMGKITKKQENTLGILNEENNRLSNLINDVLTLSRLEKHRVKMNFEKVDLHKLISKNIYANLIEEKKILIINKIPKEFKVKIDVDRFKQVFINLLSNAVKYSNEHSTIEIGATKSKGEWIFYIKDSGIGISKEDLPRIFDKFYQIENHMVRKAGGTGLGLPIVREIVHYHGGRVEVKSMPKRGSTFSVIIPNNPEKKPTVSL